MAITTGRHFLTWVTLSITMLIAMFVPFGTNQALAAQMIPALSGTWTGQGTYNDGRRFDMKLVVTSAGDSFAGTLTESTYNSVVAITGTQEGNSVEFTDPSSISGGQITLNVTYSATLTGGHMSGVWTYEGDSSPDGTFALDSAAKFRAVFISPFGLNTGSFIHSKVSKDMRTAICKGLSGVTKLHASQSGKVSYTAFAWGGFCSGYNFFVKHHKPAQMVLVEALVGSTFTAPVSGRYRISLKITLHGSESGRAGSNAFDIAQSFIPGRAGKLLGILGLAKLTNPANLVPSIVLVRNSVVLYAHNIHVKGMPNMGVDSVLPGNDASDEKFSGTFTVSIVITLGAGDVVQLTGGLKTLIQAWGNASAVVKTASTVNKIVVQQI